uniref:Uncharacterized protein n=1 Tax=Gadus morhua TaxID=8049 RepID=A0A8C5A1K0_GADMO
MLLFSPLLQSSEPHPIRERRAAHSLISQQSRIPYRQQCTVERRGFRQELDSWRHKLIHCVGKLVWHCARGPRSGDVLVHSSLFLISQFSSS